MQHALGTSKLNKVGRCFLWVLGVRLLVGVLTSFLSMTISRRLRRLFLKLIAIISGTGSLRPRIRDLNQEELASLSRRAGIVMISLDESLKRFQGNGLI